MTLLAATLVPHGLYIDDAGHEAASLDHTIWFHRPFRADEWWLYDQVLAVGLRWPWSCDRPRLHRGRPAGRHASPRRA